MDARKLVLALCLSTLFACGGDGGGSPTLPATPTPTPPPVPVLITQGAFPGLPAGFFTSLPSFTTPAVGLIEIVVDWTFAANDVDIVLVRGVCTPSQFLEMQCAVVDLSLSTTAKPERLSVRNAAADSYTLLVANHGPGDESFAYQIFHTRAAGAAAASRESGSVPSRLLRLSPLER